MQDCERQPRLARQLWCLPVAGLTLFVIGVAFWLVTRWLAPTMYTIPGLFRPLSGWPLAYMVLHPFAYGVVFGVVYLLLLRCGGLQPGGKDGLRYGLGVFLVGSLPIYLLNFASFAIPVHIILCWILQSACQYAAAGVAVGWTVARGPDQSK